MLETTKERVIQEYVPGKQITLAHLIANPNKELYKRRRCSSRWAVRGFRSCCSSRARPRR